ncbi:heat shock protein HSP60 subunit [Chlamydia felis Fe/C-56]|uniref:60 kDa chaperonin n=1 Tax=Chlamydia felis (strain Fe/C-56) TaxID=264202 RepID=Q256I3_CHLFF|nr:molecular chaperone GroEL [Chlamydia felis]BAE80805.1 heat shock protein HSP60 subunit [Chlamydia felis Fe/C-56]
MSKIFKNRLEGLSALNRGVRALAKAVTTTLGPQGSHVVIKKDHSPPYVTKHGASIAKEISLADAFENTGLKFAGEVALQTDLQVGDGSTTAVILTDALFSSGLKGVAVGLDPLEIKQGIHLAGEMLDKELTKLAVKRKPAEDSFHIATTSANNDPAIGKIISDAIAAVGVEGVFSIKLGTGEETTLEASSHVGFNSGYLSPYFVTHPETMEVIYEDASILLCNQKLSCLNQSFIHFLDQTFQTSRAPLIIIAEDFDPQLLSILIVNKLRANLPVCAIKAPGFGERRREILEDIAILTGATLVGDLLGLSLDESNLDALGHVGKIIIGQDTTVLSEGKGDRESIDRRIDYLRQAIIHSSSEMDTQDLERRLARFVGGMAQIYIGASSEREFKEKKARLEGVLKATRAAFKEGCLPGGGSALARVVSIVKIPDQLPKGVMFGCKCMLQSAEAPLRVIATNCGKAPESVVDTVLSHADPCFGYNCITDTFENLIASGVCDALSVIKFILKRSISIACLLLTSSFVIVESSEGTQDSQHPDSPLSDDC